MAEVVEVSLADGEILLRFDGDVLELFGAKVWQETGGAYRVPSVRCSARQIRVDATPDRKGRNCFGLKAPHAYSGNLFEYRFDDESEWIAFAPLLDALRRADVSFESE